MVADVRNGADHELPLLVRRSAWSAPQVWVPLVVPAFTGLVVIVYMYALLGQLQQQRIDDREFYKQQRLEDLERLRTEREFDRIDIGHLQNDVARHRFGEDGLHRR